MGGTGGHADCAAYSPPPQFPRPEQHAGKLVPGLWACVSAMQLKIHWAGGRLEAATSVCQRSLTSHSEGEAMPRDHWAHLTTVSVGKRVASWSATGGITPWSPWARLLILIFSVSPHALASPPEPCHFDCQQPGWESSRTARKPCQKQISCSSGLLITLSLRRCQRLGCRRFQFLCFSHVSSASLCRHRQCQRLCTWGKGSAMLSPMGHSTAHPECIKTTGHQY